MLDSELQRLLEPSVTGLGYELVGVERLSAQGGVVVRVYLDHEDGIRVADCEKVSRQISALMDVEDPIRGNYTLEVSSPGLDRPLFKPEHYLRFRGNKARVQLHRPIADRRRFSGTLEGYAEDRVTLREEDGTLQHLPFSQIEKAHLVA